MRLRRTRADEDDHAHDLEAARAAWPEGKLAALSFSFDDARRSQIDVGVPMLEGLGIPATFFVLPDGVNPRRRSWHEVVDGGHEIGNHTARHPCSANFGWSRHHAVEELDLDDMAHEIEEASAWISVTLGVEARSFAYPCGHTFVGRGRETRSVVPLVADRFLAGRTFNDVAINSPLHCDLAQVSSMNSDGLTFEQLRPILETALDEGSWLVLGGHEVGHLGDAETTMPGTVAAVTDWCRAHDVWIDTIGRVARRVHEVQHLQPASRR
jgi:peptidoglycan/xylan/chitin deacetylase (PgdA/CDA1 family)